MDCIKVSQNLHHYLDGEMGRFRRQAVARHLSGCAACSSGFRFEAHFRQVLPGKVRDEAPDGLRQRIIESLGAQPLRGDDFRRGDGAGPLA